MKESLESANVPVKQIEEIIIKKFHNMVEEEKSGK